MERNLFHSDEEISRFYHENYLLSVRSLRDRVDVFFGKAKKTENEICYGDFSSLEQQQYSEWMSGRD